MHFGRRGSGRGGREGLLLCEWTQSLVLTAQRARDIVPIFREGRPWIFSGASYPGPLGSARLGIMEPLSSPGAPGDLGPGNTSVVGTLSASHSLLTSSMGSLSAPGVQTLLSCLVSCHRMGAPCCLVFFTFLPLFRLLPQPDVPFSSHAFLPGNLTKSIVPWCT